MRLPLYLATRSIASWHAASIFFLRYLFLREQNCLTAVLTDSMWHLFRSCCIQNYLTPVSVHTCIALLRDAYSGVHVLSQVYMLQNTVNLCVWPWHYLALLSSVSLSEQQSHFDIAPVCNIDKNSPDHGSWMDNENVESPLDTPQNINTLQESLGNSKKQRKRN